METSGRAPGKMNALDKKRDSWPMLSAIWPLPFPLLPAGYRLDIMTWNREPVTMRTSNTKKTADSLLSGKICFVIPS